MQEKNEIRGRRIGDHGRDEFKGIGDVRDEADIKGAGRRDCTQAICIGIHLRMVADESFGRFLADCDARRNPNAAQQPERRASHDEVHFALIVRNDEHVIPRVNPGPARHVGPGGDFQSEDGSLRRDSLRQSDAHGNRE